MVRPRIKAQDGEGWMWKAVIYEKVCVFACSEEAGIAS